MRKDGIFREMRAKIYLLIFYAAACLLWASQVNAEGEAFIFLDPVFGNFRYKTVDVDQIVDDIKGMGVTDIIVEDSLSGTVAWESSLPGVVKDRNLAGKANKHFFDRLVIKATEKGIGIWLALHVTGGKKMADTPKLVQTNRHLFARDNKGEVYIPPHYDVFNPAARDYWYTVIDEVQQKYGKQIKGFLWDEAWHNDSDLYGDDFTEFQRFCLREFGEVPGAQERDRFVAGKYQHFSPEDVWWRRYALFRQEALASFTRSLSDYASAIGYSVIHEPINSGSTYNGWRVASVPHKLATYGKNGDYWVTAAHRMPSEIYEKGVMIIYPQRGKNRWGDACSTAFQGSVPCMFTYEWAPFQNGNVTARYRPVQMSELPDKVGERYKEFLTVAKNWIGADRIAAFAILTYQNGVTLRFLKGRDVMNGNEIKFMNAIQSRANVVLLHVEDRKYWSKYPLLVLPNNTVQYMPESALNELLNHVRDGHFLVAFTTQWSTAKADFTNKRDVGEHILGLREISKMYPRLVNFSGMLAFAGTLLPEGLGATKIKILKDSVRVLATFEDHSPAITLTPVGTGGIILFHFDLPTALDNGEMTNLFGDFLSHFARPAVESDGTLKIRSVLKRGDRVIISLYQKYENLPLTGTIKINPDMLGWKSSLYELKKHINKAHKETRAIEKKTLVEGIPVTVDRSGQYELVEITSKQ